MNEKTSGKAARQSLFWLVPFAGLLWVMYTYRVLLGPLLISGLIAYLLYPVVNWLERITGRKRRGLVPIVFVLFLAVFLALVVFLTPVVVSQANLLVRQLESIPEQVEELQVGLENLVGAPMPLDTLYEDIETGLSQQLRLDRVFRLIQGASANIVWLILILVTSFHLLRDWERLREWLFGLAPERLEPDLRRMHREVKVVWRTYLRGQILIMAALGILSGIGAALLGLPGALFLGLLAGALALIPSLGPATATGIAALVAWTQGSAYPGLSNMGATIAVVAVFLGVQMFEGFWLTPRIMGRRLNLHTGLVLVAIVGTLFTLGTLMALVVVPLLATVDLVFNYIRRKRSGLNPWTLSEPAEQAK